RGSWVGLERRGREELRVPDQPDDVVVAGENPHLVLGVPMDWVLRSEATEVAIGIGYDVRSEQVVVDRGCHACLSSLSHLAVSPRRVTVRLVGGRSRRPCCVQRPITVASMPQTAGHDGLDADAEQAKSIAADGPAEPKGHEDDRHHHDEAVDEDLPYVEPGQYLGQDDQE